MFESKAKKQIINYLTGCKTKIDVISGECRWNYMSHKNSVHEAVINKHDEIIMCVYVSGDYPIIHFINRDKDGCYVDNTLGQWSTQYDYYFIKAISSDDFFDIDKIFYACRKEIRKELSWFVRLFCKIEF